MNWIAQVLDKGYNNGQLAVTVLFTDGKINAVRSESGVAKFLGDPEAHQYTAEFRTTEASESWLQDQVQATFKRLMVLDVAAAAIEIGQEFKPDA
jgi:hypothetical protein